MQSRISVLEYYDVFDIRRKTTDNTTNVTTGGLPKKDNQVSVYNPFSGFSNDAVYPNTTADNVAVGMKTRTPAAMTSIYIDGDGSILCYPPNVSVPYWSKIVFRCFDYHVNPHKISDVASKFDAYAKSFANYEVLHQLQPTYYSEIFGEDANMDYPLPELAYGLNDTGNILPAPFTGKDFSGVSKSYVNSTISVMDMKDCPIFLKFDQYQSRTKVIFSGCDKNYAHDVEFKFGYHHGQMQPIKLNLSLTCNTPINDIEHREYVWNENLDYKDIALLLNKCYWSIEWIYEPDTH